MNEQEEEIQKKKLYQFRIISLTIGTWQGVHVQA